MIYADRYFTGLGQERGGLKVTIHNRNKDSASPVIYYDSVPWYLKVYLHTLKVDVYGSNATQQGIKNRIKVDKSIF
jgi:phosphatidylinositol glycan class T